MRPGSLATAYRLRMRARHSSNAKVENAGLARTAAALPESASLDKRPSGGEHKQLRQPSRASSFLCAPSACPPERVQAHDAGPRLWDGIVRQPEGTRWASRHQHRLQRSPGPVLHTVRARADKRLPVAAASAAGVTSLLVHSV